MPRYHFHVTDGQDYPDLQGTELPNLNAARVEAVRFAAELLHESAERFWTGEEWSMRVTDAADLTLFRLQFAATDSPTSQSATAT